MLEKALLTKSEHWSYESEWRLIRYDKGPGVVKFRPPNLTGVILGARASAATVEKIMTWVGKSVSPIRIYKAATDKRTYTLEIKPCVPR